MNLTRIYYSVIAFFIGYVSYSQHNIKINASLDTEKKIVSIEQEVTYTNTSEHVLKEVFFHDWANSFAGKTTPLGKRFSEDFLKRFYFAKDHERGSTIIQNISDNATNTLQWSRHEGIADIIKVICTKPLLPGESQTFILKYQIKIPSSKFTRYGYHDNGNFDLKYWYIIPAVYDTKWNIYSHKNLDDLYTELSDYEIIFTVPETYHVVSELRQKEIARNLPEEENKNLKIITLSGKNRGEINLHIGKQPSFYSFPVGDFIFISNIDDNNLMPKMKSVATGRILDFLKKKLGPYPYDKIVISESDYKNNPFMD